MNFSKFNISKVSLQNKFFLFLFSFFCSNLLSQGTDDPQIVLHNFKHPQYGKQSSEVPELMIYGDKAKSQGILVYLEGLKLEWFENSMEQIKATITTPSGVFNKSNRTIKGDEKVNFNSDSMTVEGVGFQADAEKKLIRIFSNVKVVLKKDLDTEEKKNKSQNKGKN